MFITSLAEAMGTVGQIVKITTLSALCIALVTGTAWEGAHMWVEFKELRPPSDPDAEKWEWGTEGWTGSKGGTSPALGYLGRHALRAAWMRLNWSARSSKDTEFDNAELQSAQLSLEDAMRVLLDGTGRLPPSKEATDLLRLHSTILERRAIHPALRAAKEQYGALFVREADNPSAQISLAARLGDLCHRLGDNADAFAWWIRSIQIVTERYPECGYAMPIASITLPKHPPASPAAQRALASVLVSLSAHFSVTGELSSAKEIQRQATALIDAMVSHESSPVRTRAQTLHNMYLLHRKSILGIHLAEVRYALTPALPKFSSFFYRPRAASTPGIVTDLLAAASASEIVAHVLTGSLTQGQSTFTHSNIAPPASQLPPPPPVQLQHLFADSPSLRRHADSLLSGARLSAAQAWSLCGMLYEEWDTAEADLKAADCFQRALGLLGAARAEPLVGAPDPQRDALWRRYTRVRERIKSADAL